MFSGCLCLIFNFLFQTLEVISLCPLNDKDMECLIINQRCKDSKSSLIRVCNFSNYSSNTKCFILIVLVQNFKLLK